MFGTTTFYWGNSIAPLIEQEWIKVRGTWRTKVKARKGLGTRKWFILCFLIYLYFSDDSTRLICLCVARRRVPRCDRSTCYLQMTQELSTVFTRMPLFVYLNNENTISLAFCDTEDFLSFFLNLFFLFGIFVKVPFPLCPAEWVFFFFKGFSIIYLKSSDMRRLIQVRII